VRGDFPSPTTSSGVVESKRQHSVVGDCISSFIFRFNSGEVKIVKNQKIKKEREAIYMEDKPILIVRSYMSVFLFSFFYFFASAAIFMFFVASLPRGFSRAHRTKSDHSEFSRAGIKRFAELSHTHTYIQQGISLPSSFLLIFYYFYIRKKGPRTTTKR
jgi:hypothetical protein